jgi:folate-binding protein YgfZ
LNNVSEVIMHIDTQPDLDEYTALREGAAVLPRRDAGVLVLTDADRADFLQRMTTNNVAALRPGQACVTVLTSPTARIVQVFTVVSLTGEPDALWLLPAPGETAALERHLRGQIFFMDKVRVANRSATLARLRVLGPQAANVLSGLGFDLAQTADGAVLEHEGLFVVMQREYDLPGVELVVPAERVDAVAEALQQAGAVHLTDDRAYHARRVELGRPAPGAELTGDYNPLEAGLAWACAENKGCYTGQEIIARQVTYDKVTRTLVGLRSAEPLAAGAQLTADGRDVGVVTSVAWSPALAAQLALAIVKRPHNAKGTALLAEGAAVIVQELPFTD